MKSYLVFFLICFFCIQMYLTVFGGFLWPFSGHRLFSQLGTDKKTIVQAVLTDSEGHQYFVHPGKAIPIEYSRCSGLIRTLQNRGSKEKQKYLCQYLLNRLNETPWYAFDEMFSAVRPQSNAKFVDISFEHHTIQFLKDFPDVPIKLLKRELLFP